METVVKTDFFELYIDKVKNRLYSIIKGFWYDEKFLDNYIFDQREALSHLKPGFTMIVNLVDFKIMPDPFIEKEKRAQKDLREKGLFRVAELVPKSEIARDQLGKVSRENKMPNRQFSNL